MMAGRPDWSALVVKKMWYIRGTGDIFLPQRDRIRVVHASEVIETEEPPVNAIRKRRIRPLWFSMNMVEETGGKMPLFLPGARTDPGRLSGDRWKDQRGGTSAVSTVNSYRKGLSLLIDCGANVDARPSHLVQFARMGSIYMEHVIGIKKPSCDC